MKYSSSKSSPLRAASKPGVRNAAARRGRSKGLPGAAPAIGMPRFLAPPKAHFQPLPANDGAEREAQQIAAGDASTAGTHGVQSDVSSRQMSSQIAQHAGAGRALPQDACISAETMGVDGSEVRLHDDSRAARFADSLGANAVTVGRDIFFAEGRYAPQTAEGSELLRHELSHVAQQGGQPQAIQRDIHEPNMNVPLGYFMVDMTSNGPGMDVELLFDPDPTGPYSTKIGMTQIISVTDQSTATGHKPGEPVDWTKMLDNNSITPANPAGTVGTEGGRMEAMTTGDGSARKGAYIDTLYDPAIHPRSSNLEPSYQEPDPSNPNPGQYGWLRSPSDTQPATLSDTPNLSFDADMDFQTFARGVDNQVLYGGVQWGFQIRSGAVVNDYAVPLFEGTPELTEAMDRFRGYFSHEDVIVYFDTDSSAASPAELAKLDDARDYMDRYPDTRIEVTGFADQRGTTGHNAGLSSQRADEVVADLILRGIDPARINTATGAGESTAFAPGSPNADPGSLQANRRVIVRFIRTAESPINAI